MIDVPSLFAHCQVLLADHGGVVTSLAIAGLVGGFAHCAGMCSPFVMAQVGHRMEKTAETASKPSAPVSFLERMRGAALLPYHAGRATTYVFLGILAAFLSQQIVGESWQVWVSAALLAGAGLLFVISGLEGLNARLLGKHNTALTRYGAWLGKIAAPLIRNPTGARGYTLGVLLGFLPCGWVFAALMAVASTGNPALAALAMLSFALGTFPALFVVGYGSLAACHRWPNMVKSMARGTMTINGIGLLAMAGKLIY